MLEIGFCKEARHQHVIARNEAIANCADPLCLRAIATLSLAMTSLGRHSQRLIQYRNIKCLTKT